MAFLKEQDSSITNYELFAYLTEDGKDVLYNGGFQNSTVYFSLGCHDVNYSGDTGNTYYTTVLRGNVKNNKETTANLGIRYNALSDVIPQYSDVQIGENLTLTTFNVDDNGNKKFNNSFNNHPYYPIELENADKNNFSINSGLGVSITDGNFDNTDYSRFYVLNKSPQSVYLDKITMDEINPFTHFVVDQRSIIPETGDSAFIEYDIGWFSDLRSNGNITEAYYEGKLILKFNRLFFEFDERLSLFPFQILPFEVKYEVLYPGSARFHYHGQTINDNNTGGSGELRFTLQFTAIDQKERISGVQEITQDVGIICLVHDTGYNSSTYKEPKLIYE